MAFQSSVLRDGQWVTETVDIRDALRVSAAPKALPEPRDEPPQCGIFTKTVIESPIIKWTLPVRLRSRFHNDIAFVGDSFVQISELQPDCQVHEIIRKNDWGMKIRNVAVFGEFPNGGEKEDGATAVKNEDDDMFGGTSQPGPHGTQVRSPLPPQLLVLVLESGECVFTFLRARADGNLEFHLTVYENPENLAFLGYHFTMDPTMNYMATSSAEAAFIVYELEPHEKLSMDYLRYGTYQPIRDMRVRSNKGIIHRMAFLHPRPEDYAHIILILIVARKDKSFASPMSRLVSYEWNTGQSLRKIFANEKSGGRLPEDHRLPQLIIPMRFKNGFFIVSQHAIGVVKFPLSGASEYEVLHTNSPGPTKLHIGLQVPLWTSWARPFRRRRYLERTDIIYLAREDGAIIHIEVDAHDLLPSVTNVGSIGTNISTAFTTADNKFSDILIAGGESGSGGIWKIDARSDPVQVGVLPNWSPVIDVTTTGNYQSWQQDAEGHLSEAARGITEKSLCRPDRVFTASGRGLKGNITELRWGLQSRIGLEMDLEEPIRQSWMFPMETKEGLVYYTLSSLPHSSTVLQMSRDMSEVLVAEATGLDMASRTLCAVQREASVILQVTETSTCIVTPTQSSRHLHEEICSLEGLLAEDAACLGDVVVFSSHNSAGTPGSLLHILRSDQMNVSLYKSLEAKGEVTCVCLFLVASSTFFATGSILHGQPWISVYSLEGQEIATKAIEAYDDLEAFTSICASNAEATGVVLVLGTRSGHLVTCMVSEQSPERIQVSVERIAEAPVQVSEGTSDLGRRSTVFACCDHNLIMMGDFCKDAIKLKTKTFIWLTDSMNPGMTPPPVHSLYCLRQSLSGYWRHTSLLLVTGSRILVAEVWPHIGPVPRSLLLPDSPTRVIYSHIWKCLVVAMNVQGRSTLEFLHPDTGEKMASPADRNQNEVDFISGLGNADDKVISLAEWLYLKDGKTFPFILATTLSGRLLIISAAPRGPGGKLTYWTRYKRSFAEPVYSVVGDAEGLIFCVGSTLHWEVLDLVERRLRPMKTYRLDSPATSLQIVNSKIYALTHSHSLQVIDHHAEANTSEMSLIHCDNMSRYTVHHIDMGPSLEPSGKWPVTLLATSHGVSGVWIPWRQRNQEFKTIFDASLSTWIRRFFRGRTRPWWIYADREPHFDCYGSAVDGSETLALTLDGTVLHFQLLGMDLWRFLCLIQKLAERSPAICPMTYRDLSDEEEELEPLAEPMSMHIDGDLIERCVKSRALERLVEPGDGLDLFCEYLDAIEDGVHTNLFRDHCDDERRRREAYFKLGYTILEYLLEPVL